MTPDTPPLLEDRSPASINAMRAMCGGSDREAVAAIRANQEDDGSRLTYPRDEGGVRGDWHRWNGRYHARAKDPDILKATVEAWIDILGAVTEHDSAVIGGLLAAAKSGELDDTEAARITRYAAVHKERADYHKRLSNSAGRRSLVSELKDRCAVADTTFDGTTERDWTVLADGQVLDLQHLRRTGKIRLLPPDRDRPVFRAMGAKYDPTARAPHWRTFLETSLPDRELRDYVQVCTGAALLGDPSAKRIPHFVGPKNSGKSTALKALIRLFDGYGGWVTPAALLETNGQNFDRDAFRGKRFVAISEPVRTRLDDAFLLSITGGEPVRTGLKGRDFTQWLPECVVNIAANQVVRFDTRAEEVLSRVDVVNFPNAFEPRPANEPTLDEDLAGELDGMLNWLIGGAMRFAREGVVVPQAVINAREDTADDASSAREWLAEMLEQGTYIRDLDSVASHCVPVGEAYRNYTAWAEETQGRGKALGRKTFSRDIAAKNGPNVYSGMYRFNHLLPGAPEAHPEGSLAARAAAAGEV